MKDYLYRCHHHLMLDEEPTAFEIAAAPEADLANAERRYWLFEAKDDAKKRQWFVVVGTGKSPFNPTEKMKRWMYAKTNDDDLSPEEFLNQEYREQLVADARS